MAKKFVALRSKMSPERRARNDAETVRMLEEYETLQELRKSLELTQEQVAELLEVSQVAVSKMESQSDIQLSTLRRYVNALGGKLRLVAEIGGKQFPIGLGKG